MGYYTDIWMDLKLRANTPKHVIEFLEAVITDPAGEYKVPDHPFFTCDRWLSLFSSEIDLLKEPIRKTQLIRLDSGYWTLCIRANMKSGNYDRSEMPWDFEWEGLLDWTSPWLAGHSPRKYVGWWKGEDMGQRVNIYLSQSTSTWGVSES